MGTSMSLLDRLRGVRILGPQENSRNHEHLSLTNMDSVPTTGYASASPEILIPIFQYLVASVYSDAFAYRLREHAFARDASDTVNNIDPGITALLSAMRVCRSWYSPGIVVLYDHAFLISHDRLLQFSCSLDRNPRLGALVKHVHVLAQWSTVPDAGTTGTLSIVPDNLTRTDPRRLGTNRVLKALAAILDHCPNVSELTLSSRNYHKTGVVPLSTLVGSCTIGSHLRALTIHGPFPHPPGGVHLHTFLSPSTSLPRLEVLVLREVAFPHDYTFPTLPNLLSLRLTQCVISPFAPDSVLHLNEAQLPRLRALHIHELLFSLACSEAVYGRLHTLDSVDFRAQPNGPFPHRYLSSLRTLRIAAVDEPPLLTSLRQFPPSVAHILIVWSKAKDQASLARRTQQVDELVEFVEHTDASNLQSLAFFSPYGPFNQHARLNLHSSPLPWLSAVDLTESGEASRTKSREEVIRLELSCSLKCLERACKRKGVRFRVDESSSLRPSLPEICVDEFITT